MYEEKKTDSKNPKNFKPQNPVDAFGEKKKEVVVNKENINPVLKEKKESGIRQNKKPNPTAYK